MGEKFRNFHAVICVMLPLLWLTSGSCHGSTPPPIVVCADPTPVAWVASPERPAPVQGAVVGGFSASIVRAVFDRLGKEVKLTEDLTWKRCLHEVQNGTIDFAMGAYLTEEREKVFDYSIHYNTLTPQIFYLAARPIVVNQLGDLKKYRGCGLYGSSYDHYGLKSEELDLGAGYDSLVRKLHGGRCDYFVEELEIISNFKAVGQVFLKDAELEHSNVPWAKAPSRYLVTAKNGKNAKLLEQINAVLKDMIKSGNALEIWRSQIDDIPYKP